MYYPCSENKGADQLRGYREADLRLCFRIGKNPVFSRCGSHMTGYNKQKVVCPIRNRVNPWFLFIFLSRLCCENISMAILSLLPSQEKHLAS